MSKKAKPPFKPSPVLRTKNAPSNLQLMEQITFSVPLPPPQVLREYETLVPDFAKDLHEEVKRESRHRRSNENWLVKGAVISSFFAQISAVVICLAVMYIVYQLAMADKTVVASILGGLDIVALAAVFLGTTFLRTKNQKQGESSQLQVTEQPQVSPEPEGEVDYV